MHTIWVGFHSLKEAKRIRESYRQDYGRDVRVRFRGRGRRVFIDESGIYHNHHQDLPLRYAKRISVYVDVEQNRIREEQEISRGDWRQHRETLRLFGIEIKEKKIIKPYGIVKFLEGLK